MALKKQFCSNHSQRAAIGVCVMTGQPICAECSTRYEGVNYSIKGLEMLKRQRSAESKKISVWQSLAIPSAWLGTPLLAYLLYLFYLGCSESLINLAQLEF